MYYFKKIILENKLLSKTGIENYLKALDFEFYYRPHKDYLKLIQFIRNDKSPTSISLFRDVYDYIFMRICLVGKWIFFK